MANQVAHVGITHPLEDSTWPPDTALAPYGACAFNVPVANGTIIGSVFFEDRNILDYEQQPRVPDNSSGNYTLAKVEFYNSTWRLATGATFYTPETAVIKDFLLCVVIVTPPHSGMLYPYRKHTIRLVIDPGRPMSAGTATS